jgi:hypothetical protein
LTIAKHNGRAHAAGAAPRPLLKRLGQWLAILGSGLLINQFVLRFFVGTDLWGSLLSPELLANDQAAFRAGGVVFVLYAAFASAALWLGPRTVEAVLDDAAAVSPAFLLACLGAAGAGMGVGWFFGVHGVGGPAMLFYWTGLGILWTMFAAMAWWGGRHVPLIRRDWTLYSYALALLPLTTLPVVPLWAGLAPLDVGGAWITAVTLAFPAHLLAAHFVIVELLDRRKAPAKPASPR